MKRNSGHRAAVPDMAASTCSHRQYLRQASPIFEIGSIAFEDVVPAVAQAKNGTRLDARSFLIAAARASGFIANWSSTSIRRRFSRPIPAIWAAFSTDECACAEV